MSDGMSDQMDAGPELDARVAVEVMGWRDYQVECVDACQARWFTPSAVNTDGVREMVPEYSTDIGAAWQVVERLSNSGYEVIVCREPMSSASRQASCEIAKLSWRGSEHETAESAPLAICRAALACVRGASGERGTP